MEATDEDGSHGPISTLTITFDRSCLVFSDPSGLTLATQADVEKMVVCTSVREDIRARIESSGDDDPIVSLLPMRDITVSEGRNSLTSSYVLQ